MEQNALPLSTLEYQQIVDFLYDEADILSAMDFTAWAQLLADDIHYLMPVPQFFEVGKERSIGIGNLAIANSLFFIVDWGKWGVLILPILGKRFLAETCPQSSKHSSIHERRATSHRGLPRDTSACFFTDWPLGPGALGELC